MYTLTEAQFELLTEYFELAMTAISDDEQETLVFMEGPIRDMLREVKLTAPLHQG